MSSNFELLARAGYGARGMVYMLLGGLALASATIGAESAEGSSDALSRILALPFGRFLIGGVAIGLLGFILWRLAQGFLDADNVGSDMKGVVGRSASLVSAGTNTFLMLAAASIALAGIGQDGGEGESQASGWLLQQPFGPYFLGAVAIGVVGAGLVQIWRSISGDYRKHLDLPKAHEPLLNAICQFGIAARGALIAVVGGFVFYAALTVEPEEAGGITDALNFLLELPYGSWFYGLAALGLVAYGGYSIIQGLFRRMDAPDLADVKRALPTG
jgi:hypothetical protein